PARAEATAWLKPLPPGPVMYWPAMVAPVAGSSLQRQTWSTLKEPTTMTGFMEPLLRLDYGGNGQAGRGGARPPAGGQPKCDSTPAMVAVMKVAMEPPSTARRPKRARSWRRSGARPPMPPIWIAIELKLAKPHSA